VLEAEMVAVVKIVLVEMIVAAEADVVMSVVDAVMTAVIVMSEDLETIEIKKVKASLVHNLVKVSVQVLRNLDLRLADQVRLVLHKVLNVQELQNQVQLNQTVEKTKTLQNRFVNLDKYDGLL
jgi:hypothetical protein